MCLLVQLIKLLTKLSIMLFFAICLFAVLQIAVGEIHERRLERLKHRFRAHPNALWQPGVNEYFKGKPEGFFKSMLMKNYPNFTRHVDPKQAALALQHEQAMRRSFQARDEPYNASHTFWSPESTGTRSAAAAWGYTAPKSFDYRDVSKCKSLKIIRTQAPYCGDCWAVSTASAFSDAYCLKTKQLNMLFSAKELGACANNGKHACDGGSSERAAAYIRDHGLVTGDDPHYTNPSGCIPYAGIMENRNCPNRCENSYPFQLYRASRAVSLRSGSVDEIKEYIYKYGPVVAAIECYKDFEHFNADNGDIYHHVEGPMNLYHAFRIIGWGEENGTPYWQAANSWGTNWGADNGYFKILRGSNECGLETNVVAIIP